MRLLNLCILLGWIGRLPCANASLPCETDSFCQTEYNTNLTVCLKESGVCSNPFQQGCLASRGVENNGQPYRRRVCNSNDESDAMCSPQQFNYNEIRVHNANWESSLILSWIYQIVLSEIAYVPSTVGLTTEASKRSGFYNADNEFLFSEGFYPYEAVERANIEAGKGGACADLEDKTEHCCDILPEVWPAEMNELNNLTKMQIIEPPTANGLLGRAGFRVPAWTLEQNPELGVWYGLQGDANREKLAALFPKPVTWLEYCEDFSPNGCNSDMSNGTDPNAAREPTEEDDSEENLFFKEGVYSGYFTFTEKHDCGLNPSTCTGTIITPPCSWGSPIDARLFWNDITGLSRDGTLEPYGGYTQSEMIQIWRAAAATRNHVIMHWYEPEPTDIDFQGTEYEMQTITWPEVTVECLENLPNKTALCSGDIEVRRGEPAASCGNDVQTLSRIIAANLAKQTFAAEIAEQSPGYETVRNLRITNLDINKIIKQWLNSDVDPNGFGVREAVCDWVVENLNDLQTFVPRGHPRARTERSDYKSWYHYTAQGFAGAVSVLAFIAFWMVVKHRHTKTMVFAQPVFMHLILVGFVMISVGAVLNSAYPTKATCTSAVWLIQLGYTIELVPVLVKTAKINKLIESSKKQKRINISRQAMLMEVFSVVLVILSILIAMTISDPPVAVETLTLSVASGDSEDNFGVVSSDDEAQLVESDIQCVSSSNAWRYISFAWQAVLLILAAFLAFQSRDVMSQLNESTSLAVMVYSHFLFICLRGVCLLLSEQDIFPASAIASFFTVLYGLDALSAMTIYVFPKLVLAQNSPEPYKPGMSLSKTQSVVGTGSGEEVEGDVTVLVCSANLGNAKPTISSMEEWIPMGGCCEKVESLEDVWMPNGSFGIIAIAMQEATWTDKGEAEIIKGEEITEEEIFNALESKNTADLRNMVQDVLGENYMQIVDEQRGQMRMHIWVNIAIAEGIKDVKISGANTGVGNLLANKGGIVATILYNETRLSFVGAHLAAHEGESYYNTRCENIRAILREAKTFELSSKFDIATSSHHSFFAGDLNFRVRFKEEGSFDANVTTAINLISFKDFDSLYAFDELEEGLANGDLLSGYKTLTCDFAPTFKVERKAGVFYKSQRMPSWTDRVLFKSSPGLGDNLKALAYEACPDFITSDHKPIRSAFLITPNKDLGKLDVENEITMEFKNMQCFDLPALSGVTDPYLMFMWDGVDLYSEKRKALHFFRRFFKGCSWPRTPIISKTLNPEWTDPRISLQLKNTKVGSDAMLFIAAMSHDMYGKDAFLGSCVLNVRDLVSQARAKIQETRGNRRAALNENPGVQKTEHQMVLPFDLSLCRDGNVTGHICFDIEVRQKMGPGRSSLLSGYRRARESFRLGGGKSIENQSDNDSHDKSHDKFGTSMSSLMGNFVPKARRGRRGSADNAV